jgi:hypothetical protein
MSLDEVASISCVDHSGDEINGSTRSLLSADIPILAPAKDKSVVIALTLKDSKTGAPIVGRPVALRTEPETRCRTSSGAESLRTSLSSKVSTCQNY